MTKTQTKVVVVVVFVVVVVVVDDDVDDDDDVVVVVIVVVVVVLMLMLLLLSAALRSNAADYVLLRFILFYFLNSQFVLRNYPTDSHKILKNCVFWCLLNKSGNF